MLLNKQLSVWHNCTFTIGPPNYQLRLRFNAEILENLLRENPQQGTPDFRWDQILSETSKISVTFELMRWSSLKVSLGKLVDSVLKKRKPFFQYLYLPRDTGSNLSKFCVF